jgi:hypothetical protein
MRTEVVPKVDAVAVVYMKCEGWWWLCLVLQCAGFWSLAVHLTGRPSSTSYTGGERECLAAVLHASGRIALLEPRLLASRTVSIAAQKTKILFFLNRVLRAIMIP